MPGNSQKEVKESEKSQDVEAPAQDPALLKELQCSVSCEFLSPPVVQCINGHSICGKCRPNLKACPECRGRLTKTRNRLVERMLEHLVGVICENSGAGCTVRLESHSEITKHHLQCPLRPFLCFNCDGDGDVTVYAQDLVTHIKDVHGYSVSSGPTVSFNVLPRAKLRANYYLTILFEALGDLFWY